MLELNLLTVMTLRRAREKGIEAHASAKYVCILHPDGAAPLAMSVISLARTLEFIDEMAPHEISVEGATGEDVHALREALLCPEKITLH